MPSLVHIFNLLLYNFLQAKTKNVAIFHCWKPQLLQPLAKMFNEESIYTQYINLLHNSSLERFQYRYFDHEITKLGVFLDLECERSEEFLIESSQFRLFSQRNQWLIYDRFSNLTNIECLFQHAFLSVSADLTYIQPNDTFDLDNTTNPKLKDESAVFVLYDIHNKGSHYGGTLNITIDQAIKCNASKCEVMRYLSTLYERPRLNHRRDLSSVTLPIATLVTELSLKLPEKVLLDFLASKNQPHIDWLGRLGYHLFQITHDVLHFNITYVWTNAWSLNDHLGGAVGELVNKSAELSATPLLLSERRLMHLSVIIESSPFRVICIFRTPRNAGIKSGVFLDPFATSVWFTFTGILLCVGALLWLIFRVEHQCMRRYLDFIPSLLTTCLISFGAACIQGSFLIPRSMGGRIVLFSLMLTTFLMYNYYTSIVVSSLLGSPVRSNIKTIQQLADSSLDVGIEPIPYIKNFFDVAFRPDVRSFNKQKIDTKKDPSTLWMKAEAGVLRVQNQPNFAFISESSAMYYYIEKYYLQQEICELNEIGIRPESLLFSYTHQNSTYKELYRQIAIRILETGLQRKHVNFWTRTKLYCYNNNYLINVGMEYTAPLFIMLLCAYIMVLIILGMEIMVKRYVEHKQQLHTFSSLADNNAQLTYMQYINVNEISSFEEFHRNYLKHEVTKLGIFLDMNCKQTSQVLEAANEEHIYNQNYHWLLYDHKVQFTKWKLNFSQLSLSINADITYVIPNETNVLETSYITYDVYNRGNKLGGILNMTIDQELLCNDNNCTRLYYLSDLYKRSRFNQRRSLSGLTLRMAAVATAKPLTLPTSELLDFLGSTYAPQVDVYARFCFQLRDILKDMLECNYSYIFFDVWSKGEHTGGSIGELLNGNAEIASAYVYSLVRSHYFNALTEVSPFRTICLFRTPQFTEFKLGVFLTPFTPPVWYIYIGLLLAGALILWFIFHMEHIRLWQHNMNFMPSLLTTCLISFGAACIQGSSLMPRSIGGRMVIFALMLTSFLMYNYYTSIVVSSLLALPARSDVKTIQQLADSRLDVAVQSTPYTRGYVETSPRNDIRRLYNQKLAPKKIETAMWLPDIEGVLKVRDTPGFVFVADATTLYDYVQKYYLPHQICELNEIPLRPEAAIYTLVNRNLTYKELMKLNEVRIMETGILQKHRNYWIRNKLHCYNTNNVVNVSINYAAPLFIMLLGAYILSTFILICELICYRYRFAQKNMNLTLN